jgi:protein TonB
MQDTNPIHRQRLLIVASVLLLHVLGLWGLQSGLLQRAATLVQEIVVPVSVIAEPPPPPPVPVTPPKPLAPTAQAKSVPSTPLAPVPTPSPAPIAPAAPALPQAIADPAPSATAATGSLQAQPAVAAAAPSPVPAPSPKAEPTSVEADYLVKPNREFPLRCQRRREQGTVVVHVLIGLDGRAEKAEIASSSGSACLNREALDTALSAQYKPVMRGGLPVQAWRDASFKYVLPE